MATKAQKVRLGLFFLLSGVVLVVFLIFTAGLNLLKKREAYLVEFNDISVGGLRPGAAVKYQGLQIGRVDDRWVSPDDIRTVVVGISIEPRMAAAIREDTQARLYSQGLTGLKHIELVAGSQSSPVLPPGSVIAVGGTFLSDLDKRAELLTNKIEAVLDNVRELTKRENSDNLGRTLSSSGNLMDNADRIISENRVPINETFENLARTTHSLALATESLQATMDSLHQMLTGAETLNTVSDLQAATRSIREQLDGPVPQLIANMNRMTENLDRTFTHIDLTVLSSRDNILSAMLQLEETLQNVKEASELIREDPSVLIRGRGGD